MSARASKRCPRCGLVKPASAFYRRRGGTRTSPYCQPCTRAASRETRRRRQDPASVALLRATDRTRQRRQRAARGLSPQGGDAA